MNLDQAMTMFIIKNEKTKRLFDNGSNQLRKLGAGVIKSHLDLLTQDWEVVVDMKIYYITSAEESSEEDTLELTAPS